MKAYFRLTQLSKPSTMYCKSLRSVETFSFNPNLSEDKFNELFNYCKMDWDDPKEILIKCDSINEKGIPVNPKFIEVLV